MNQPTANSPSAQTPSGNLYFVSAMYEAVIASEAKPVSRERIVFLVRADTEAQVRLAGQRMALEKQHAYENGAGEEVRWTLADFEEVRELFDAEIKDGTEVYWQTLA